jgi:hypothetical protein
LEVTVRPALAGFPYIAAGQRSPEEAALAVSSGEPGCALPNPKVLRFFRERPDYFASAAIIEK